MFIDAHSHLADKRIGSNLESWMDDASRAGISFFMQGGVGPEDWQAQQLLLKKYPGKIGLCFGLHPYWVIEKTKDECEAGLDLLSQKIHLAKGLGEAGLDFRKDIVGESHELQIGVFAQQVELAEMSNKPIVLHIVQAHDEALKVLKLYSRNLKGMVHSFNSSYEVALEYLKLGLYISVGGPICRVNNQKLHQAIRSIPMDRILIETDSPDQPPSGLKSELNPPISLIQVSKSVGELKSLSSQEVLEKTTQNFKDLFGDKI